MNDFRVVTITKDVGDMLKTARQAKNLTYEDVHKFIKIHPKYLKALEENDYLVFSSPVHVKGFLKVYAHLLDLNVEEVLAFFRREFDEENMKARSLKPLENPKFVITPALVTFTFTFIMVLGFFGYLFYQYRSYTGAPNLVIDAPSQNATFSQVSIDVAGKTDRDSSVLLNGQKINLNSDGTFATKIDLSEGLNTLNFISVSPLGRKTAYTRSVFVKKELALVAGADVKKIKLEIFVSGGSSVVVVGADGQKTFDGTMLEGTSRVFEASDSIKLKASDAGSLAIRFNGDDLGVFGKKGEAKERDFR